MIGNMKTRRGKVQVLKSARKVLLLCGILSSLLYIGTDVIAAMQWEGYSYVSQAVSELQAVGAPTRPFIITFFSIYDVLLIAFGLGFGTTVNGRWFRRYSIGTILLLILFGALAGLDGPRLAAELPTPWLGIKERINIYGYLLWVLMLAVILLRSKRGQGSIPAGMPKNDCPV